MGQAEATGAKGVGRVVPSAEGDGREEEGPRTEDEGTAARPGTDERPAPSRRASSTSSDCCSSTLYEVNEGADAAELGSTYDGS